MPTYYLRCSTSSLGSGVSKPLGASDSSSESGLVKRIWYSAVVSRLRFFCKGLKAKMTVFFLLGFLIVVTVLTGLDGVTGTTSCSGVALRGIGSGSGELGGIQT